MSAEKELSGNIGEWSELYAFFRLLGSPVLVPCDSNLVESGINLIPVTGIFRGKGPHGELAYFYKDENGGMWEICIDGSPQGKVASGDGTKAADELLKDMLESCRGAGESAKRYPKAQKFLESLFDNRLKGNAVNKQDITLRIEDIRAGASVTCGFSIKSYIGSDPTLLNSNGDGTNFEYCIEGLSREQVDEIKSAADANSKRKIVIMMDALRAKNAEIRFVNILNARFSQNLRYIDTCMPRLVGELLLTHYQTGVGTVREATEKLADRDPLHFGETELYVYKIKKFLEAVALGLRPSHPWTGTEEANGGFLIVKPDGALVTYHLYNRQELDDYLYQYTRFEHPSTSRHKYGTLLIGEDGRISLKLALQIRFKKP